MTDDYKQKYEDLMKRWPPVIGLQYTHNSICSGCGMDLNKLTNYVCYMTNCPSQGTAT